MLLFNTPNLSISHLTLEDATFICELLNQSSFIEYIGDRQVRSIEDARRYLTMGPLASYEQFGFGLFRVALSKNDEPIGICGILKRDYLDYPDLGYALLDRFAGKGYATEAARGTLGYAQQTLGLTRIVAITALENPPSIRLLTKLGFIEQAHTEGGGGEEPGRFFQLDL